MARPVGVPADLRGRLERTRRRLLALSRALDRLGLAPPLVPADLLTALFELDADYAEALVVLDWPPGSFDVPAMVRDTRASLACVERAEQEVLTALAEPLRARVTTLRMQIESDLPEEAAYHGIPGRDRSARR
jgi:hypothetical protein